MCDNERGMSASAKAQQLLTKKYQDVDESKPHVGLLERRTALRHVSSAFLDPY